MAIAVYVIRVREPHSPRAANLLIIGGGVALPTAVLGALLAYGLQLPPKVLAPATTGNVSIQVTHGVDRAFKTIHDFGAAPTRAAARP